MKKTELRNYLKAERFNLPLGQVDIKSQVIARRLFGEVDWPSIKSMHIYQSVPGWKEVNTKPIIDFVEKNWPKTEITIGSNKKSAGIPRQKFDLIIVPTLGFDKDCYRLGLGGGFYDRFLVTQPQAQKIGLAYATAQIEHLPREPHDQPLDKIITEEGIID